MIDPATPDADDEVRLELLLPRKLFNGLRTLGEKYGTGVYGVIRHLVHNAVDEELQRNTAAAEKGAE
jgi:hypothetical protein